MMSHVFRNFGALVAVFFAGYLPVLAQHDHMVHSQYADQERSPIPSITKTEFEQLRAGAGMGFAKPAELNHYPGPKHVLELADSLSLSVEQRTKVEAIRQRMSGRAVELGTEYLHAEHQLNRLFADGTATESDVADLAAKVGSVQAELRTAHLAAHIETAAVLTPDQIARYDELRGYGR